MSFDQIERTKWVHDRIVDTKKGKGSNATAAYGEQTGCAVRVSPEEVFVCKNAGLALAQQKIKQKKPPTCRGF
jgi:predicted metal-dependent HD superfamily phosphohydrolase